MHDEGLAVLAPISSMHVKYRCVGVSPSLNFCVHCMLCPRKTRKFAPCENFPLYTVFKFEYSQSESKLTKINIVIYNYVLSSWVYIIHIDNNNNSISDLYVVFNQIFSLKCSYISHATKELLQTNSQNLTCIITDKPACMHCQMHPIKQALRACFNNPRILQLEYQCCLLFIFLKLGVYLYYSFSCHNLNSQNVYGFLKAYSWQSS